MGELLPVFLVAARLLGLLAPLLGLSLLVGLARGDAWDRVGPAFLAPATVCLLVSLPAWRIGARFQQRMDTPFQGFLAVVLGWLSFSLAGAFPYTLSGALPTYADAFFETMSGFTTTGASVFRTVESLPSSVLFWRSLTQFVGGLGIIALFVAVLPALGAGGVVLFKSEVARSVIAERLKPRIADTAKWLWCVYLGLVAAETLALLACGLDLFDAVCHAFTTLSTGGFSTRDGSLAAFGPAAQWTVVVFMFLGGVSFLVHGRAAFGDLGAYRRSDEVKAYSLIVVAASVVATLVLDAGRGAERPILEDLRHAAFQVVSIMTTTGYASEDFDAWDDLLRFLLVLLMVVGGCSGSTAGGAKVFRLVLVFRALGREIQRLLFPSRVLAVRLDGEAVDEAAVRAAALLVLLFLLTAAAGSIVLLGLGVGLLEAVSGSFACVGCVGPALGSVGPTGNYADIPSGGKIVLSVLMLMGRLEIYSVLVLFLGWRFRR